MATKHIVLPRECFLDEWVTILSNRCYVKYFRNIGYNPPDQHDENNSFEVHPWHLKPASKTRVRLACIDCKAIREVQYSDRALRCKCCNNKLQASKRDWLGDKNPNYNPEITDAEREKRELESKNYKFRAWSLAVKERDNFTCVRCGSTKRRFNSHHLNCFIDHPDERYDINNGVCLCVPCHKEFHSKYGLRTTKMDFEDWRKTWEK